MRKWLYLIVVLALLWLIGYAVVGYLKGGTTLYYGDKIAVVEIKGMISSSGNDALFGEGGVSSSFVVEKLKAANDDNSVKGILLNIDSSGGAVVASSTIANAVKNIQKPVVAYIGEVGASGAYWVASAADVIVADPLSITGSIGVAGSYLEFSGLMEKYGVKYEKLTAGEYKEMGGPYQKLSEKEKRILEEKIDIIHARFISDVVSNRKNLPANAVKDMSTGIFYLGEEAYSLGLVDYLGDKDFAINLTKKLAAAEKAKLVEYKEKRRLTDFLEKISAKAFYSMGRGIGYEMLVQTEGSIEITA